MAKVDFRWVTNDQHMDGNLGAEDTSEKPLEELQRQLPPLVLREAMPVQTLS